ncbi:glycosyltransferase family 4 protein [Kordiimonas gwangyangensis]|uniref:glycosyltransferase family 4 protein n=2 Tax=Kordiimonas gwangyangensis TaxID=288022 RepID=UPI0003723709|nr:glycosyltransferase family 4 protein [Kordiimonas gwangyangensis]
MQGLRTAAIVFEPDGYVLAGDKIMGRQAAGNSFLRAAIEHAGEHPLWCYTPRQKSAAVFAEITRSIDPTVKTEWCPAHQVHRLSEPGTLYLPGPNLGTFAGQRLRAGIGAYSLCGVTHTISTHSAMDAITGIISAPVMPWDALICTSNAVRSSVQTLMHEQQELLSWRMGTAVNPPLPQLPVIPLAIQCDDFSFSQAQKIKARQALGIDEDTVAFLFVGRLSYHAKAHPHAMMLALEKVAQQTGKPIAILQCGWFANPTLEQDFRDVAAKVCPSVKCLFTDGRNRNTRDASWAAADVFISLSDNFQETFGITPLEAMAAGLPVIVSDWDGYKDTVPDGVTGFRIPTWTIASDDAHKFGARYEAEIDSYDRYSGYTCLTVSVDHGALEARITELATSAELRKKLGEAGRTHAREHYDWTVVYPQYQALWAELGARRQASEHSNISGPAVMEAPARMNPYRAFASYPSHTIGPETKVTLREADPVAAYTAAMALAVYNYGASMLVTPQGAQRVFTILTEQPGISVGDLTTALGAGIDGVSYVLSVFAKMGLVTLAAK